VRQSAASNNVNIGAEESKLLGAINKQRPVKTQQTENT
jgi:hypothetical protein